MAIPSKRPQALGIAAVTRTLPRITRKNSVELSTALQTIAFKTQLGWMGMLAAGAEVHRLTLGHSAAGSALQAVRSGIPSWEAAEIVTRPRGELKNLVSRLIRFAKTGDDNFLDVAVALGELTEFQSAVIAACRNIPPGQTKTYGELAAIVGAPGAARAVGSCMRKNTVPLIIPCHRVVAAGGKLGGYSAPQGQSLKSKLLELESGVSV